MAAQTSDLITTFVGHQFYNDQYVDVAIATRFSSLRPADIHPIVRQQDEAAETREARPPRRDSRCRCRCACRGNPPAREPVAFPAPIPFPTSGPNRSHRSFRSHAMMAFTGDRHDYTQYRRSYGGVSEH